MDDVSPIPKMEGEDLEKQERTLQDLGISNVWSDTIGQEMQLIGNLLDKYNFVAMDTEFPGIVFQDRDGRFQYPEIRKNVNELKLIQVGFTLADDQGRVPSTTCSWQFNLKFDVKKDRSAPESIQLLTDHALNFHKHGSVGIDPEDFAYFLSVSGLVLNDRVRFLSFHSGYDFAYLVRLLTGAPLPEDEDTFLKLVRTYFPHVYDLKVIMRDCHLHGGLDNLAFDLNCPRHGGAHQAGSDSWLTLTTYFTLCDRYFDGQKDLPKYDNTLFGLGPGNVLAATYYPSSSDLRRDPRRNTPEPNRTRSTDIPRYGTPYSGMTVSNPPSVNMYGMSPVPSNSYSYGPGSNMSVNRI